MTEIAGEGKRREAQRKIGRGILKRATDETTLQYSSHLLVLLTIMWIIVLEYSIVVVLLCYIVICSHSEFCSAANTISPNNNHNVLNWMFLLQRKLPKKKKKQINWIEFSVKMFNLFSTRPIFYDYGDLHKVFVISALFLHIFIYERRQQQQRQMLECKQ